MTLTQLGIMLATFAALGAAIKAGPPVWSFVRNVARIPRMTESIWLEFGRNGGSTTRDRIEEIARHTETVIATVEAVHASTTRLDTAFLAHSTMDATTFGLLDRRLDAIEIEVRKAAVKDAESLDAIMGAVREGTIQQAAYAAQRKEEHEQTDS